MAEFERGDLIVVNMPGLDDNQPAIVSYSSPNEIGVRWILHPNSNRYYEHVVGADCMFWPTEYHYIEKVGHIDLPTGEVHNDD